MPKGSQQGRSRPGWGNQPHLPTEDLSRPHLPRGGKAAKAGLVRTLWEARRSWLGPAGMGQADRILTQKWPHRGLGRADALQGWDCHPSPLVSTSVTSGKWFNLSLAMESTTAAYPVKP